MDNIQVIALVDNLSYSPNSSLKIIYKGKARKLMTKNKKDKITYPLVVHLEAVLMENKEVIHFGKSLGYINAKQLDLIKSGATKLARGNEIVIAVGGAVA